MEDYAQLYRSRNKKMNAKDRLRRIGKILATDMPPVIMVMCIMLLVKFER